MAEYGRGGGGGKFLSRFNPANAALVKKKDDDGHVTYKCATIDSCSPTAVAGEGGRATHKYRVAYGEGEYESELDEGEITSVVSSDEEGEEEEEESEDIDGIQQNGTIIDAPSTRTSNTNNRIPFPTSASTDHKRDNFASPARAALQKHEVSNDAAIAAASGESELEAVSETLNSRDPSSEPLIKDAKAFAKTAAHMGLKIPPPAAAHNETSKRKMHPTDEEEGKDAAGARKNAKVDDAHADAAAAMAASTEPAASSNHPPSSNSNNNNTSPAVTANPPSSMSHNNNNNPTASTAVPLLAPGVNAQQQPSEPPQLANANPHGYTAYEMATIDRCEQECKDMFPTGRGVSNVFDNPMAACQAFNDAVGKQFGFKVSLVSSSLQCLSADPPNKAINQAKKREQNAAPTSKRERKSHRCGCKFKVNFSRYNNKNSTDKRVVLTKANYRHCHGCRPSSNQLLVHHVKSGTHTRTNAIASDRIQALINMHRFGDYVDAKSIRNALKDALPDNYPITPGLIANVRARVKKAAESY